MFLDAHAHFFSETHLDDATEGAFGTSGESRPAAYTLREHLDGLIGAASSEDEVVCVNVAFSALPTSKHVLDSFHELSRLQTLYGDRYSRVKCVLGTCRADEPDALSLLTSNPLIIGARVFLKGIAPKDAAAHLATLRDVTALLASNNANGKWLEIFAMDVDTLLAAVLACPSGVPLMVDHLGAWAAPPLTKYQALLSALAARQQQGSAVLMKGPGHRTSLDAPVTAAYAVAAVSALGADAVLLQATDAPHVFSAVAGSKEGGEHSSNHAPTCFAQRGFVAGPLGLLERVRSAMRQRLPWAPSAGATRFAEDAVLRFAEFTVGGCGLAPCPNGMIHARRPRWYSGDDVMIAVPPSEPPSPEAADAPPPPPPPVAAAAESSTTRFGWTDGGADEVMHTILFRPLHAGTTATAGPASSSSPGEILVIVGSGYTGFLGLYPALLSQELTRRGVNALALEYPCYGASKGRGENDVSIGAQARAWSAAAR